MADHSVMHDPRWFAVPTLFTEVHDVAGKDAEDHVGVGGFVCTDCDAQHVMFSLRGGRFQIESSVTPDQGRQLAYEILAACDRVDGGTGEGKH